MTNLCTLAEVRDTLQLTDSETDQDALITRLIGSVTDFISKRTRRVFGTGVETRLFDGNDKGYLILDDYQEITSVRLLNLDNTAWKTFNVSTELKSYPLNTSPKTKLQIVNVTSENPYRVIGRSPFIFPKGYGNVEVVANWGSWATPPSSLTELAINMVVSKTQKAKVRGIKSVSIGGESMSFSDKDLDESMTEVLNDFKKDFTEVW